MSTFNDEKWKSISAELERLIRPQTYPIGLKIIRDPKDFPLKTQFPESLGIKIALCQANTIARRFGWTIGVRPKDIICWPVHMAFGWETAGHDDMLKFFMDMGYCKNEEIARKRIQSNEEARNASERLGLNAKDTGFCFFPLNKAQVEPDLVFVYGSPAQIMRLTQGYIYHTGHPVDSSSIAAGACCSSILDTLTEREPKIVLSGNGERVFAMTQDSEMMFATPADKIDMIIEGMNVFHKHGQRYPVPSYQFFTPQFIGPFLELKDSFK